MMDDSNVLYLARSRGMIELLDEMEWLLQRTPVRGLLVKGHDRESGNSIRDYFYTVPLRNDPPAHAYSQMDRAVFYHTQGRWIVQGCW